MEQTPAARLSGMRTATLIVAGAFFMEVLDSTVIATALPRIAGDFGVPAVNLSVGMTAYLLAMSVFVPISGWVAERLGARRVFAGAIVLFVLTSVLCGLSTSLTEFTIARLLQGMAGAMMSPVGRLIVLRNTEKKDLVHAIAVLVWPALTAPVVGPALGGYLTTYFSWRWNFFINVPLGVLALIAALIYIRTPDTTERKRFDGRGFVLTGLAIAALIWGLDELAKEQIDWLRGLACLVAGSLLGWAALRHLRRAELPMLNLAPLQVRSFAVTVVGGTLFRISVHSAPLLLPLMFQLGFGLNPLLSGALVLWLFAGNLAMKAMTTRLLRWFGFRQILLVNGTLSAAAMLLFCLLEPQTPRLLVILLLFLSGMFRSMQFTAYSTLAFAEVPPAQLSGANGFNSMINQIGVALGIAIGALALEVARMLHAPAGALPDMTDFHLAFAMMAIIGAVSVLDALTLAPDAGAEVSGHARRRPISRAAEAQRR